MRSHRAILTALGVTLIVGPGVAAAAVDPPGLMNYQGVLRDDEDKPLDGAYDMVFRFFDDLDPGTPENEILVDSHLAAGAGAVTVSGGLFSVTLGSGAVSDGSGAGTYGSLAEVFRDYDQVYVAVEVESEVLSPRVRVVSAGYALNADHFDGQDSVFFLDTSAAGQTKSGDLGVADLSASGDVSVGGQISITGGSPAAGKVLTSDATGLGAWADPVPGPEGPAGPQGPQGPQGPAGATGRPVHSLTTVDATDDVGVHTAITIGENGLPVIAHASVTTQELKIAMCSDPACTSATNVSTGTTARDDVQATMAITIGKDGFPVIAHSDGVVTHCEDAACGSVTERRIPAEGFSSIAVGVDGFPVVSRITGGGDLELLFCEDVDCDPFSTTEVDNTDYFRYTSLVIAPDGLPIIAYAVDGRDRYRIARCQNADCTVVTKGTIFDDTSGSGVSHQVSMAIGRDGFPIMAVYHGSNADLEVIHCETVTCSSRTLHVIDGPDDVGKYASLTIGDDGYPVIAYYDETNLRLKVAKCIDLECTDADIQVLDTSNVGRFNSVAIGTDGMPIISYYDGADRDLMVAHCSNRLCLPYYRPR